jgi:hypothetical protein
MGDERKNFYNGPSAGSGSSQTYVLEQAMGNIVHAEKL